MSRAEEQSGQMVDGYSDGVQLKTELKLRTYEYLMPFNYENVKVRRKYRSGQEFHGVELNPLNSLTDKLRSDAGDSIAVEEHDPIVRAVIIGSACAPPGYVMIECEPVESFYRSDEMRSVMPVRFRIGGLWGMHMRCDQWWCWGSAEGLEGELSNNRKAGPYENPPEELLNHQKAWMPQGTVKGHWREAPLAGMSCAVFEIPKSKRIRISGGCELLPWSEDNYPEDIHYSFRIIRTTVAVGAD